MPMISARIARLRNHEATWRRQCLRCETIYAPALLFSRTGWRAFWLIAVASVATTIADAVGLFTGA